MPHSSHLKGGCRISSPWIFIVAGVFLFLGGLGVPFGIGVLAIVGAGAEAITGAIARGSGSGVGVIVVEGVGSARSLKLKDISGSFSMSDAWSDAWSDVRSTSDSISESRQGCVSVIVKREIKKSI